MDITKIYSDLNTKFSNLEIYQNHPLTLYSTVKIGGCADILIHTKSSNELKNVLRFIHKLPSTISLTILGNGSNVLISDTGIRGIVIKNSSDKIEILPNNQIKVDSGTQLSRLINISLNHGLIGLEEFAYIPSTIGGAIAGNIHGINKSNFSKFVASIEKFNNIILSAVIKLEKGDSAQAKLQIQKIIQKKSRNQPMNSLGCVFKNIPTKLAQKLNIPISTGQIIDQKLNLKGYSVGHAQISPSHANFIVNNGHATAKDYFSLIQLIQSKAQETLGFQFELETKLLGEF